MFTLTIETDSDAFTAEEEYRPGDNAQARANEIARILGRITNAIQTGGRTDGTVRDTNGNTVGNWSLT